jgi:hypothetical protein
MYPRQDARHVADNSFGQRSTLAGASADLVRYGYTGREHDADTGLLHYQAAVEDDEAKSFYRPINVALNY